MDLIGGIVEPDGIALYPHPDVVPGVPMVLYGPQYPGGPGKEGDFAKLPTIVDPYYKSKKQYKELLLEHMERLPA